MVTLNNPRTRKTRGVQSMDQLYGEAKNIDSRSVDSNLYNDPTILDTLHYIRPQRVMNRSPDIKITVRHLSWLGRISYQNFILDLYGGPFYIGYICDKFNIYQNTYTIYGWIGEDSMGCHPISKSELVSSIVKIGDHYKDALHIDAELL